MASKKRIALWTNLTGYQRSIVKDTGCAVEDAVEVEDIMRCTIFHSELSWLERRQFKAGAKQAYKVLLAMRAAEEA